MAKSHLSLGSPAISSEIAWAMPLDATLSRIMFAQIETATYCNYRCPYCQVSHIRRPPTRMNLRDFARIVRSLETLPGLRKIYLNGYNEPSLVPDLLEQIRMVARLPARLVLLSNGFGFTPDMIREIIDIHPRVTFGLHLSAVTPAAYQEEHGVALRPQFLDRLREIGRRPDLVDADLRITVMGRGDTGHHANLRDVREFFAGTRYQIDSDVVHDRAGSLPGIRMTGYAHDRVMGCTLQRRHLDWIHVTASGNWILCCQDYAEDYVFGNVLEESIEAVASSPARRRFIEMVEGLAESDSKFICRRCKYALIGELRANGAGTAENSEFPTPGEA